MGMSIFDREKLQRMQEKEKKIKKHTIMIVDDEETQLKSLESLLSDDYNVITDRDAREALDIIEKMEHPEEISLVISDQRMPELTGIQLFERLVKILPNTIRIIITGYDDIDVIRDFIKKNKIYDYIRKPFDPDVLMLKIKNAIEAYDYRQSVLDDPLTGLHNRNYIHKSIHADIALAKRDYRYWLEDRARPIPSSSDIVFLMVDVDNLGSINDIYGREAGDRLLIQFANLLREICSQSDIAVRWKDDKFLIVNRFIHREQAKDLAEQVRQEVKDHIFDLGKVQTKRVTCSIGFAAYPFQQTDIDKLDWEEVIDIAEKALYTAKNLGPNTWLGIFSTEKTDMDSIYQEIGLDGEELLAKLKKLDESGELKILTYCQNGLDKNEQDDIAASSRLPEGFYKPIKVKKYLEFNREAC
jgi:diguanylate cyclase (GGDEF)-like protein